LVLNGSLVADSKNVGWVSIDEYDPTEESSISKLIEFYASRVPDIIYITAPEQITALMLPLEQKLFASNAVLRPFYLLSEDAKVPGLLSALASPNVVSGLRRRIRGVGVKSDASSVSARTAFEQNFWSVYGRAPVGVEAAAAYDSIYAMAYAIAATDDALMSGPMLAHGLSALASGRSFSVGARQSGGAIADILLGQTISLFGTSGPMRWNWSGELTGQSVEVWCVGVASGEPKFGSSGLMLDVDTGAVSGTFVQCQ
jgi:hypothetical protein